MMMSNILNAIVIVVLVTTFVFGSVGEVTLPQATASLGVSVADMVPTQPARDQDR